MNIFKGLKFFSVLFFFFKDIMAQDFWFVILIFVYQKDKILCKYSNMKCNYMKFT